MVHLRSQSVKISVMVLFSLAFLMPVKMAVSEELPKNFASIGIDALPLLLGIADVKTQFRISEHFVLAPSFNYGRSVLKLSNTHQEDFLAYGGGISLRAYFPIQYRYPLFDWNITSSGKSRDGAYLGLTGGYQTLSAEHIVNGVRSESRSGKGWGGGVEAGYQWLFSNQFVLDGGMGLSCYGGDEVYVGSALPTFWMQGIHINLRLVLGYAWMY